MIHTRPWSENKILGTKKLWHFDSVTGDFHIETIFDVEGLIEENQAAFNASHGKRFGDGKMVARIPLPMYYEMERMKVINPQDPNDGGLTRVLNDRNFHRFRTWEGRV